MKKGDMIWVEGERELFLNMQKTLDGTTKAAMQGLERAALNIVADAKKNLRDNGSIATDKLRASGRVQLVEGRDDEIDAGFFSQDGTGGYAAYVEYGTRASSKRKLGWMIRLIKEWLRKKTSGDKGFVAEAKEAKMTPERLLSQKAFFIARKIIKKGTKPHPFFSPAVENNKKQVNDAIAMAVKQVIK